MSNNKFSGQPITGLSHDPITCATAKYAVLLTHLIKHMPVLVSLLDFVLHAKPNVQMVEPGKGGDYLFPLYVSWSGKTQAVSSISSGWYF